MLSKRNGIRAVTGPDASIIAAVLILIGTMIASIALWEYAAHAISGFAAEYSSPSEIWSYLQKYSHADLRRLEYTARRGALGIIVAFFVAYTLGVLIPLYGRITFLSGGIILIALWFPKLPFILFVREMLGYNALSVYTIGLWNACTMMLALGFFQSYRLVTDRGADGEILEAAVVDGANRWQIYRYIVLPMLRANHVIGLYVVAPRVWAGVTFAEALILGNIEGLGERMVTKSQYHATFGHFYAVCLYLFALEVATWCVIWTLATGIGLIRKR